MPPIVLRTSLTLAIEEVDANWYHNKYYDYRGTGRPFNNVEQ